jgi:transposase
VVADRAVPVLPRGDHRLDQRPLLIRYHAPARYSSRGFRAYLRSRGIAHTIPEKTDQRRHRMGRGRRGGRPPGLDREAYRRRNIIERCFNRLKGFRGIATRYDKTATSYEAAVTLASFLLWARSVCRRTLVLATDCGHLGRAAVALRPGQGLRTAAARLPPADPGRADPAELGGHAPRRRFPADR